MINGRRADSDRRRDRVRHAVARARADGQSVSVASIARMAGVDRSFLYRHSDLLAEIHEFQTCPTRPSDPTASTVTYQSLKADLVNAQQRIARTSGHNRLLERRLSELLGEHAWRESGLGAAPYIDQLQRRLTELEQRNAALQDQLDERQGELDAARAANRELIAALNKSP